VEAFTVSTPFTTRDTVETDTLANFATSSNLKCLVPYPSIMPIFKDLQIY
jgi:hypothetical protein